MPAHEDELTIYVQTVPAVPSLGDTDAPIPDMDDSDEPEAPENANIQAIDAYTMAVRFGEPAHDGGSQISKAGN